MHKLNTVQKKQMMQNTDSVAFYDTWPGNKVGLICNVHEPTRGGHVNSCMAKKTDGHKIMQGVPK